MAMNMKVILTTFIFIAIFLRNMLFKELEQLLPNDWRPMDIYEEQYKIISIPPWTEEYHDIELKVLGNYYSCITGIYKIQNPCLYTKYALKAYQYAERGPYERLNLFHDTSRINVESIALYNLDWRCGSRIKYGPGVYFSISPSLANKHSTRCNDLFRSMFIMEVLVQNVQNVDGEIFLPDFGYDTVLAHNKETFVKYFDSEYYPRYFVDYVSLR